MAQIAHILSLLPKPKPNFIHRCSGGQRPFYPSLLSFFLARNKKRERKKLWLQWKIIKQWYTGPFRNNFKKEIAFMDINFQKKGGVSGPKKLAHKTHYWALGRWAKPSFLWKFISMKAILLFWREVFYRSLWYIHNIIYKVRAIKLCCVFS